MAQCQATNKDGTPCKARCAPGKTFCSFHDPVIQTKTNPARGRGRPKGNKKDIMKIKDILKLLQITIKKLEKDKIDTKKAHEIGFLASTMIRALESDTAANEIYDENMEKTAKEMGIKTEDLRAKLQAKKLKVV